MKFSKNISKQLALFLVALMLTIIPNLEVYSAVGNYQECSMAITASQGFSLDGDVNEAPAVTMLTTAVVAAYVFLAHNMITGEDAQLDQSYIIGGSEEPPHSEIKKEVPDFSQFDN